VTYPSQSRTVASDLATPGQPVGSRSRPGGRPVSLCRASRSDAIGTPMPSLGPGRAERGAGRGRPAGISRGLLRCRGQRRPLLADRSVPR
jgi:hypothetical protein